jgi:uncharacterized protein YybS (DUF2232 family)
MGIIAQCHAQRFWRLVIIALLLGGVLTCFLFVSRFFAIDSCLDRGGHWNYEIEECEL